MIAGLCCHGRHELALGRWVLWISSHRSSRIYGLLSSNVRGAGAYCACCKPRICTLPELILLLGISTSSAFAVARGGPGRRRRRSCGAAGRRWGEAGLLLRVSRLRGLAILRLLLGIRIGLLAVARLLVCVLLVWIAVLAARWRGRSHCVLISERGRAVVGGTRAVVGLMTMHEEAEMDQRRGRAVGRWISSGWRERAGGALARRSSETGSDGDGERMAQLWRRGAVGTEDTVELSQAQHHSADQAGRLCAGLI